MVQLKDGHQVSDDELEDQRIPSLKGYSQSRSGETRHTGGDTEATAKTGGDDLIADSDLRVGGGSQFEGMPGDGDLSSRPAGSDELDDERAIGSTAGGTGQGGSTRSEGNR